VGDRENERAVGQRHDCVGILARHLSRHVTRPGDGCRETPPTPLGAHAQTGAPNPICGSAVCSPGLLAETRFWLCDSHTNSSRNLSPSSFIARGVIDDRICMFASPAPTAKKASAFAAISDCTSCAALWYSSVGSPSVIRKTHGW